VNMIKVHDTNVQKWHNETHYFVKLIYTNLKNEIQPEPQTLYMYWNLQNHEPK
jgi:hypothetical protein